MGIATLPLPLGIQRAIYGQRTMEFRHLSREPVSFAGCFGGPRRGCCGRGACVPRGLPGRDALGAHPVRRVSARRTGRGNRLGSLCRGRISARMAPRTDRRAREACDRLGHATIRTRGGRFRERYSDSCVLPRGRPGPRTRGSRQDPGDHTDDRNRRIGRPRRTDGSGGFGGGPVAGREVRIRRSRSAGAARVGDGCRSRGGVPEPARRNAVRGRSAISLGGDRVGGADSCRDSVYGVFSIPCAVCRQTAFRKVESKSGQMSGSATQTKPVVPARPRSVVLGLAQIETDVVVRLHAELLDWRSGLKSAPDFSVGDSYYFDRHLSVNRFPSFRRNL